MQISHYSVTKMAVPMATRWWCPVRLSSATEVARPVGQAGDGGGRGGRGAEQVIGGG